MELIDTDVLIDVQRGFAAAADWFATDPDVGVPGFVVMELVQDARNSDEVHGEVRCVPGVLSLAYMAKCRSGSCLKAWSSGRSISGRSAARRLPRRPHCWRRPAATTFC